MHTCLNCLYHPVVQCLSMPDAQEWVGFVIKRTIWRSDQSIAQTSDNVVLQTWSRTWMSADEWVPQFISHCARPSRPIGRVVSALTEPSQMPSSMQFEHESVIIP